MIKVVLTLLAAFNLVDATGSIYTILNTVGNAFFYFMSIILTYATTKRLNGNPFLAMVAAAVLLHPNLGVLLLQGNASHFGLPITSALYSSSTLPMLLMVPFTRWIERLTDRICPDMVRVFLKSLTVISVSVPAVPVVIGLVGAVVENYLADGVNFLYNRIDWLIVVVLSAVMPFTTMTEMRYTLIPICTISLVSFGYDTVLITTIFCSNLTQGGALMAVAVKARDNIVKPTTLAAGIFAIMADVAKPTMYGITLKYKTLMVAIVCGAGTSEFYSGITHLMGYTMGGLPFALTLIQMINGEGLANPLNGVITLAISLGVSFLVSPALYRPGLIEAGEKEAASAEEIKTPPQEIKFLVERIEIKSPLNGTVISLKEVSGPVFFDDVLGEGAAVIPSNGEIYASADGMINAATSSKYVVGITANNQAEILVHAGLDTVSLKGESFNLHCKMGDGVKAGDPPLEFDLSLLKEKGYNVITPVLISNPADFVSIKAAEIKGIAVGGVLLTVVRKKGRCGYEERVAIALNSGSCAGIWL